MGKGCGAHVAGPRQGSSGMALASRPRASVLVVAAAGQAMGVLGAGDRFGVGDASWGQAPKGQHRPPCGLFPPLGAAGGWRGGGQGAGGTSAVLIPGPSLQEKPWQESHCQGELSRELI